MNFFQHQDKARKNTSLLVLLLCAAVLALIAATVLVVGSFLYFLQSNSNSITIAQNQGTSLAEHFWYLIQSPLALYIALGVLTVVGIGGIFKLIQLGSGGRVVAESLGGKLIDPSSSEPQERKVLNIVEEMAIASGNPVPPVYVLEDQSINAFAAGLNRRNAVIGVTRGCISILSRDELQGVIAHEFSHIHNGDMRLNMRLIAILHGILMIGLIGYYIAHGSRSSYHHRSRRDGRQVSLGLALMAIGYGGTFFGNIIKAAVSRQREFLADASAVQFTRNPSGISGALKKIGGYSKGSMIEDGHAAEYSHFFFGQGIKSSFTSLMATHPPLEKRIKRIEPRWRGEFPKVNDLPAQDASSANAGSPISHFANAAIGEESNSTLNTSIIDHAGEATSTSIQKAHTVISAFPKGIYDAAHQAFSARSVVYGLLLEKDTVLRDQQLEALQASAHPATFRELLKLLDDLLDIKTSQRLPLLMLSMPALKQLSAPQYKVFKKNLAALIKADKKVSLFEWSLYRIITKTLEQKEAEGHLHIESCMTALETLFYLVALVGQNENSLIAFNKGMASLNFPLYTKLPTVAHSLPMLDKALDQLEKLKPLEKPKLLKALIEIINADEKSIPEEKELFRAVADTLNCPIPPL